MSASHDWTDTNVEIQALRESLKAKEAENLELVKRNQYLEGKLRDVQSDVDQRLLELTDDLAGLHPAQNHTQRPPDETL